MSDEAKSAEGPSTARPPVKRPVLLASGALAAVLALFVLLLATRDAGGGRTSSPLIGKPAPEIGGRAVVGAPASLAALRGKFVVVNFFATWCTPCQVEHPELRRYAEAHGARGDGAVVAVLFPPNDENDVRDFFAERGGDWSVVRDDRAIVDYGVTGIPESFLVGPDGVVLAKVTGGVTARRLDALIEQARRNVG